ncbi:MAG: hypothetical protein M3340_03895 [Actinomycetota bacterium]|nr:hypothetical protein [Actinomycetota bacterium]
MALTGAVAFGDRASDDRPSDRALRERAIQADARGSARQWERRERAALTPAARKERARSRTRHRDLSASSALRVTRQQFPAFSSQPAFKGYQPRPGEFVERYLHAGAARVSDGAGHRSIVESTYPLTGRTPSGRPAPIDLSLRRHGSGFAPASAPVEVRFPGRIADGIAMTLGGGARVVVRPAKTRKAKVARLGSGKVMYANTDRDTDTLAAAMPSGVELFTQIRSADSPTVHAFRVDLPRGAKLRKRGRGAEIVRRGQRLGVVNPPLAWDADNRRVPVGLKVAGNRLRLAVPHRRADLAYPVMVDPLIESFQYWRTDPNMDWLFWEFDAPKGFEWSRDGEWGAGAYLLTTGGEYPHTLSSHASFAAPGDAYVYAAEFNLLRHQPPGGEPMCVSAGIFSERVEGYESPVFTECREFWDVDYGTCVEGTYPDCSEKAGSPPNELRFQYWALGNGPREAFGVANMGGALVKISDRNAPSVVHGPIPTGWAESHELEFSARDTGLGLRRMTLTSPTAPVWPGVEKTWECDGSRFARSENLCSTEWETLSYLTGDGEIGAELPEGIQTLRATAEDVLSRTSSSDATIRIDTLPPDVKISGGLWDLRDRVATAGHPLDIRVDATDGVLNGPDSDRRAGVASIEVKVGGKQIGFARQTCEDSCPLSLDAKLDALDGPQTVSVEVFDLAGHRYFDSWTIHAPGPGLYASQLAEWKATVERQVEEALGGPLSGPMPALPTSWRTPSTCRSEDGEVRVCFDFVKQWQTAVREWLEVNKATGSVAARLPDMPRYDYGRDRVARWLARAAVFAFERVRENAANPLARRTVLIGFHHPVSSEYLASLTESLRLTHAKSLRGTFEEIGKPITAGAYENPDLPEEPILFQVDAFYEEQLRGIEDVVGGLKVDLRDETAEEAAETEATMFEVEEYRTALLGRAPFVTAIVADVDVAGLVRETGDIATPIKTADLLSPEVPLEADDAPGTDRSMTADADVGDPGPDAKPGETEASGYMPSAWNGRTHVVGDIRKNSYMGLAWTQPGTLGWYQGDDPHDLGFQLAAYPLEGDSIWSDRWSGGWKSNLPDAYRDDLVSEAKYKVFAIGSANGRALKFQRKYFGWFNTGGGSDSGTVVQAGQRTTRPRDEEQGRQCAARDHADKACLFADHTAEVQTYPVEDSYHRVRRDWP